MLAGSLLACRTSPTIAPEPAGLLERARLLRIEDTRRAEPSLLDSLLAHRDADIRAAAARTAGRLGGSAHRGTLHTLAEGADTIVAPAALFALGLRRDTSALSIGERALRAPAPVAEQGAWLLGEIGEPARPAIVRLLGDPALAPAARGALLLAAARLRPVPAAAVAPWVASPDTALAWRAAYVLARGRSAAGVRTLLAAASSPSGAVREQVARGLLRPAAGDSLGAPAVAALAVLVLDREPRVRVGAVRALASYPSHPQARALVPHAMEDRDAGVRLAAAQSLDGVLPFTPGNSGRALERDTAFVVQRAVADWAMRQGRLMLRPDWRGSEEWELRAAAAELDASGPASEALLDGLAVKARDGDGRVRAAALGAVARLADSAATRAAARAQLRAALLDPDVGARAAALAGLASGATTDDLAAALDAYAQAGGDRDADARLAFWQLADSALRRGPAPPAAVEARLAALPPPSDPLERAAAARIPRFAPWRDGTGEPRPIAWYLERVRESLDAPVRRALVETGRGSVELELFAGEAPLTVHNFVSLASSGYFDGLRFHRVIPGFVVQGGDPRGDGSGGPGHAIRDEINPRRYLRGTVGMALSGPHTGGSQFFVTHSPQPHLDGGYTVFGQLRAGGDTLDRIVQGDRIVRITIR